MKRAARSAALVIAAGLLLTGCGGSDGYTADDDLMNPDVTAAPTSPATSSTTPAAPATSSSTPSTSRPAPPATSMAPPPTESALNPKDRLAAAKAAKRVLLTWARPTLPYEQWWAELSPLLTDDVQETYSYTDPINVPALKITGKATEDPGNPDAYVTTFYFETTMGRFGVDVSRAGPDEPWKAFSIIFPGSESMRQ